MSMHCFHGSTPSVQTELGISNPKNWQKWRWNATTCKKCHPNDIPNSWPHRPWTWENASQTSKSKTKFVEDKRLFRQSQGWRESTHSDWDWTMSWFFRVSSQPMVTTCFKSAGESYWVLFSQRQFHLCPAGGSWTCHNTWARKAVIACACHKLLAETPWANQIRNSKTAIQRDSKI